MLFWSFVRESLAAMYQSVCSGRDAVDDMDVQYQDRDFRANQVCQQNKKQFSLTEIGIGRSLIISAVILLVLQTISYYVVTMRNDSHLGITWPAVNSAASADSSSSRANLLQQLIIINHVSCLAQVVSFITSTDTKLLHDGAEGRNASRTCK